MFSSHLVCTCFCLDHQRMHKRLYINVVSLFNHYRELTWHDLAFFNSDLYEGLRRMLLDAEEGIMSKEEFMAAYCCYFEVSGARGVAICSTICAILYISICGAIG